MKTIKLSKFPGSLYFGPCPFQNEFVELKAANVTVIVNLMYEFKATLEREQELFPTVIHSPIPDFSTPEDLSKYLDDIELIGNYLSKSENIYLHCLGGRGRTGMTLATLLVRFNGLTAEQALTLTKELADGPETEEQKEFVKVVEPMVRKLCLQEQSK